MRHKRIVLCTLFIILFNTFSSATGPSYITSEIRPISVNDKGEILCRTRFQQNGMGAHRIMDMQYGICVLTKDTIIAYNTILLSGAGYADFDVYMEHKAYWDSIFTSPYNQQMLSEAEYSVIYDYDFKEANVKSFERNEILTLQQFKEKKKIDLEKTYQQALYGAKGIYDDGEYKKVKVMYDFGHIILLNNDMDDEEPEISCGAEFNYPNPALPQNENERIEFGLYEMCSITGVLFIE